MRIIAPFICMILAAALAWPQIIILPKKKAAGGSVEYIAANGQVLNTATTDTVTTTTTRTIAAGEHVVCTATIRTGGGIAINSVSVDALSLTLDKAGDATSTGSISVYSARASSEITSGATITMVVASSTGLPKAVSCASLSGVAASSYVRASATANNNSNSPSVTTDTTPASGDLVWNSIITQSTNSTTADADYTLHMTILEEFGYGSKHASQYRELSSGGAQTATWSWGATSYQWRTVSVVYKP